MARSPGRAPDRKIGATTCRTWVQRRHGGCRNHNQKQREGEKGPKHPPLLHLPISHQYPQLAELSPKSNTRGTEGRV